MAALLAFTVLLVASLSGIMVYGQKCAGRFEKCGTELKCCQKMYCVPIKNNTYPPGVCYTLADASNEAGVPTIALKPLSAVFIVTSIWALYGHLIA